VNFVSLKFVTIFFWITTCCVNPSKTKRTQCLLFENVYKFERVFYSHFFKLKITTLVEDFNTIIFGVQKGITHLLINFLLQKLCFLPINLIIQNCYNLKFQKSIFFKLIPCILDKVAFTIVWLKLKISSTFICKIITKWDNSLKMSIVKKLKGLEGLIA